MTQRHEAPVTLSRRRIGRCAALFLTSFVAAFTALPTSAGAVDKLALRLDWITEPIHLPFFLATQRGWFKAADLDVSIEDGTGSTTTVQLVSAGSFDVGVADLSPMAVGRGRGLPIISIAGIIRKGGVGFVVPESFKVTSLKDFVGKQVFYTAGSFEGPFVEPLFRINGVSIDQVNMVNMDASAKIPAFLSGRADAMITTVPPNIVIAKGRRDSYGVLFSDYGFSLPGFGIIARPETLKERGPAIKRFVSVVCQTWTYILASHENVVEASKATLAFRPNSPLPLDLLVAQTDSYRPYFYTKATEGMPIGFQDASDWAATIKSIEEAKVMPPGSKPSDYFTNDFIDLAYAKQIVAAP